MTSSHLLLRRAAVFLERAAKQNHAAIWERASEMLGSETANRVEVNLGLLSRVAKEGGALFVPGKVLGSGPLDKKLVVGAFAFSASARREIAVHGGSAMSVEQFLKKYPKGSAVKLVG